MFNFPTWETHFLFKGTFYDQIDGVAMASLLAPFLANLFMVHYEKELLSNYDGVSSSYYTRYVDDIFSVFNSHIQARQFFSYLNLRHPNVKVTMETEVNKVFTFLDVLIDNRNNILNTNTYHKSTNFGLLLKFDSFPFVCARCNSCYIGETCRHFKTRIDEHAKKRQKI